MKQRSEESDVYFVARRSFTPQEVHERHTLSKVLSAG
jgi:hypothetical protein